MRPLRDKQEYEVTDGAAPGEERILGSSRELDVLSDQGSIDTLGTRRRYACDCGCYKPVGGRCYECGALSCVDCHGHCASCAKPICLAHSVFLDPPGGGRVRRCGRCQGQIARRQRLVRITRTLLSAFVRFEEHDET